MTTALEQAVLEKKTKIVTKLAITVSGAIDSKIKEIKAAADEEEEAVAKKLELANRRVTAINALRKSLSASFDAIDIDGVKKVRDSINTAGYTEEELKANRPLQPQIFWNATL